MADRLISRPSRSAFAITQSGSGNGIIGAPGMMGAILHSPAGWVLCGVSCGRAMAAVVAVVVSRARARNWGSMAALCSSSEEVGTWVGACGVGIEWAEEVDQGSDDTFICSLVSGAVDIPHCLLQRSVGSESS